MKNEQTFFAHDTAVIDDGANIGKNSKIWHFSHIMGGAQLGESCNIGQNVVVHSKVIIGKNVKIQNNVSVYDGVILEDNVFCGPSCVFTNIINPRSEVSRNSDEHIKKTTVKRGATIGANATILCGITIGKYAFIGAGAVVTKDVADYELVYGSPAAHKGWACECGSSLDFSNNEATCSDCQKKYKLSDNQVTKL